MHAVPYVLLALFAICRCTRAYQQLERCPYSEGGPTVSSRTSTIQYISFGAVSFEQDCVEAEARGPGVLNLTSLGETELMAGEMASIDVQIASCTLAWPHRYGEVWLDWRGSGQFERLIDSVGGTYEPSMTSPFKFRFRVPADAVPGVTRLRVGTYVCQSCFREVGDWKRLNPCHGGEDSTMADLAVRIVSPPNVVEVAPALAAVPSALYYKLNGADVSSTGWPAKFLKYGVLVVDPGLNASILTKIRRDLPGRKLVAYTCMGWAYVRLPCTNCTGVKCSGCPGSRCVDRLDYQGKPYWNDSYNVRNLHDGKAICPFGHLHSKVEPVAAWIPMKESVDAMVRFHTEVTLAGYDGVRYVCRSLPRVTSSCPFLPETLHIFACESLLTILHRLLADICGRFHDKFLLSLGDLH
eukprot:COSAG02_NODE_188_length_30307_cov_341.858746_14_plen_411_part_00